MSGGTVKLRAEFKDPLTRMTMDTLRAALNDLEVHAGVPASADLKVAHYQQGGWEVVATWSPEDKPAEGAIEIRPSVTLEEDPAITAARIRDSSGYRKIKDNPQA